MKGSVLGLSDTGDKLDHVQFNIALTMADQSVDTRTIVFNYYDDQVHYEGLTANVSLSTGSTERGAANMIEGDEVHVVTIDLPADANVTAYKTFTIQMVPPTGATITLNRALPGTLLSVMDLH
jgi:archaellin